MLRDTDHEELEQLNAARLEVDMAGRGGVAALFPIRVVSRLTGINPVTIRAWERRYRLVRPERTPGGHRLYSRADVELLRAACRLLDQGVSIGHATRLLDQPAARRSSGDGSDEGSLERFLGRLNELDEDGMSAVFEAVLARGDHEQAAGLLDRLPAAAPELSRLERQVLEGWLAGLLAFRTYQRNAQAGERRVLVCIPGGSESRSWALVVGLGLADLGFRAVLLCAPDREDLLEAARRTGCAAVILGGTGADWPGLGASDLPVPAWLAGAGHGFHPASAEPAELRRQVVATLRRNGGGA
jgi:MerR family transcriptional regulator, light-induced transcriptional regulator